MSIQIPMDKIEERLDHGNRWVTGWGDYRVPRRPDEIEADRPVEEAAR